MSRLMRSSDEYSILVTLIGTVETMEPPLAVSVDSRRKSAPGRSDTENSIVFRHPDLTPA